MARKKTAAKLNREIAKALRLFYLSEDQTGGAHAKHFERFDDLGEALDALARLPHGSITYGTAAEGPKFMIVWAAPAHTDLLYWTDGDLSAQLKAQDETREIRRQAAPLIGRRFEGDNPLRASVSARDYFAARFKRAVAAAKKRGDH